MGDHGQRIDLIRYAHSGRIEERQPLFAIYLPQWWKNKHKDWLHNLRFNKYRLVTNFDIHRTLMDIVYEGEEDAYVSPGTQKGLSLFRNRLSPKRQCYDVGIGQCLPSPYEHFLKHNQANSTARVWRSTKAPSIRSAFKLQRRRSKIMLHPSAPPTAASPSQTSQRFRSPSWFYEDKSAKLFPLVQFSQVRHGIRMFEDAKVLLLGKAPVMTYRDFELTFTYSGVAFMTRIRIAHKDNSAKVLYSARTLDWNSYSDQRRSSESASAQQ